MSVKFKIAVQLFTPMNIGFNKKDLPRLAQAVKDMALIARGEWVEAAIPSVRSGQYLKSIKARDTGEFASEVYSDSPYAKAIEEGTPARDMKKMLDTSPKTKISKTGRRYLIIPFRHGAYNSEHAGKTFTPTGLRMMPQDIHEQAKKLNPSHVLSARVTHVADSVDRSVSFLNTERTYQWGNGRPGMPDSNARLPAGLAPKRSQLHKTDIYAGMVKFQNPTGEKGGAKHTQYLTFRVMSEDSRGWLVPAIEGKHLARSVAEKYGPMAEKMFDEALKEDLLLHRGNS